ncbi:MAG: hypothetical protein HYZ74_00345 [Elusimicrobia bacterium]|nr:hypothetical protein [Elusimicrobiota bacterium]
MKRRIVLAAALALLACGLLILAVRRTGVRRREQCRALAGALDKTVRAKSPRIFEGIVESHYSDSLDRCLAALEYHYRPCPETLRKKTPLFCAGPDADIAVYSFQDGGARPMITCERFYEARAGECSESIYGNDGLLLSSRDVPPEDFPRLKAELMSR